jgi:enterochelin esterase family protein
VGQLVGQDPKKNQMSRLLDSDLWYKTYRFRRDLRALYHLSPDDLLTPYDGPAENWALRPTWQADPLNPNQFNPEPDDDVPEKARMSILTLPDAPPQPWIVPREEAPEGEAHDHLFKSQMLQNERDVQVYVPPGYADSGVPYPLLVFLDAFYYTTTSYIPTVIILNNMIQAGVIPPIIAAFVFHRARGQECSCNIPFTDFLHAELIPWLRRHYRVTSDPARTVIAGMSLSGLGAAFAAFRYPDTFGNVLSQSGWFGWKPDEEEEYEWLPRQFAQCPRMPLKFYLDVGLLETFIRFETGPSLLLSNRHMRTVLQAKGYSVHYKEFNGGHDGINWRGTLSDGLIALLGRNRV